MKKLFTIVFLSVGFVLSGFGQLSVTSNMTPQQYVENVLLGPGVTVSNVTFNGNANYTGNQIGQFNYGGSQIPFGQGLIMGSGGVAGIAGPNNAGGSTVAVTAPSQSNDPQLNVIGGGFGTFDVGTLEFDFVPSGSTVGFNFLFGSEEYNEYVCGTVNDVFGFFVTGPNPAGGSYTNTNLAVVPGTSIPITINTVNNGTVGTNGTIANCNSVDPNWQSNTVYFAGAPGADFQADGMTQMITIQFDVECNQTYHFKFAIGDGGDTVFDSWVLLQSGSFSAEVVEVAVATVTGDTTVYEGCTSADFVFTRPTISSTDTLHVNYTLTGTATNGVDFNMLPNPVTFLPGEDTVVMTLDPIADGISDNFETVTITATTITDCGDTIISSGTLTILDSIPIDIDETDTTVLCVNDSVQVSASATGLFGPFTYSWSDGQAGDTAYFPTVTPGPTGSIDYYVTATNSCGYSNVDTVTITLNQTLQIDSTVAFPSACNEQTGAVIGYGSGFTGTPYYNWSGPGQDSPNDIDASVWQNLSPGWYYFTITDDVCTVNDSAFVDIQDPPTASGTANPSQGPPGTTVTFTNTSQGANSFDWNFMNGQTANGVDMSNQVSNYPDEGVYNVQLIAYNGACTDTAYITVIITTTPPPVDPEPVIPPTVIHVPNVITPNNDNSNDLFFIETANATEVELTILNRWGNVIYDSSGPNPAWDGKNDAGIKVDDGTYFFKYVVKGAHGEELTGHGFVQVIGN